MLNWTIVFFIITMVTGLFGFANLTAAVITRILFVIFLILFLATIFANLIREKNPTEKI